MKVRRTSTYTVEVQAGNANRACDEMKARCTVPLAASGVEGNRAFIRFRASSDDVARLTALKVWSGPIRIYTGFGVGQREVPAHPTAGKDRDDMSETEADFCAICNRWTDHKTPRHRWMFWRDPRTPAPAGDSGGERG